VILCIDSPLADPDSTTSSVLGVTDKVITILFLIEAILKITVMGFVFNGKESYLRNGWNILDFIIVFASSISLLPFADNIEWLKVIRLIRILRPLRILSRNIGMQIAVESLINSASGIGNLLIIFYLLLLLFSILGTNFYKGRFWYCDTAYIPL
jgi:hypothetical protein